MENGLVKGSFRRDRTRAAEQVLDDLRGQILAGRLARGTRLPSERDLATHYDVSQPTVREALRALSAMSLVEIRHGSGTYVVAESSKLLSAAMTAVVQLEHVNLLALLEVSEALYVKSVRLAVGNTTEEDLATLSDAADRCGPGADEAGLVDGLAGFLKALAAISRNPLLISLCGFLIDTQIALAKEAVQRSPSVARRIVLQLSAERAAIIDALRKADSPSAEAAVLTYTARAMTLVREHVSE
ncbi:MULTISPECIES: FadR/GntR family transcriptional regulator [unclassified Streptomyces]|uniref:FadR/GntR family transcriptional regulator n=1 Tax=unclassified Streptomyces TaxID=2593676 RepID=UPI0035DCC8D5